jgi:hypothetical protein
MKHSKHLLLSIFCLTVLASCANNKPIKQPEIVPEPITTNVEVIENDAEVQMIEEIAVDQLQETSLEEIPSIKYSTYE